MSKYFIGIDPGIAGGLTCLDELGTLIDLLVMPVIKVGTKNRLDPRSIIYWINKFSADNQIKIIALEEQRAMHKIGEVATFQMGRGYGMLEGIVSALDIPYQLVRPVDWQREMFIGYPKDKTKALSVRIAQQLYPLQNFKRSQRCTKIHDGLTDATLIAEYIRRKTK